MGRTFNVTLSSAAFVVTVIFGDSAFAQYCSPMSVTLESDNATDSMIARCPTNPEATFKILDRGRAEVATIALRETDGTAATYRIEAVAPGQTTFKVRYQTVVPPIRTRDCRVAVTVIGG